MIAAEFGSTAALATFRFQPLSAGKGTKPFRLPPWPRLIALQADGPGGGGGGGGGFPPEVAVTFKLAETLLPGSGLLTLTEYTPALETAPLAVSCSGEIYFVVTDVPPKSTWEPATKLLPE